MANFGQLKAVRPFTSSALGFEDIIRSPVVGPSPCCQD